MTRYTGLQGQDAQD